MAAASQEIPMAAASQDKTAALEGDGVLGQTLSFPIADGGALIPCQKENTIGERKTKIGFDVMFTCTR